MVSTCTRNFIVGGNWKANGTKESVDELLAGLAAAAPTSCPADADVDVVVAPPALHLRAAVDSIETVLNPSLPRGSTPWRVASQDVGERGVGAFTGDSPAELVADAGATWAIVGHSERRASPRCESDAVVGAKAAAALRAGLSVIACVGETLEEREAGRAVEVVERQLAAIVEAVSGVVASKSVSTSSSSSASAVASAATASATENGTTTAAAAAAAAESNGSGNGNGNHAIIDSFEADKWRRRVVVAYEPVWAIGTGRVATPHEAQEMHAAIRAAVAASPSLSSPEEAAEAVRIQYGGSVSPKNAAALAACPDVDGFLVGGASLKAADFVEIVRAGAEAKTKSNNTEA